MVFSVNTDCFKVDIYGVYRATSMYRNRYQMIKYVRESFYTEMYFTKIYGGTPTMNIILGGNLYLFNAIEPI